MAAPSCPPISPLVCLDVSTMCSRSRRQACVECALVIGDSPAIVAKHYSEYVQSRQDRVDVQMQKTWAPVPAKPVRVKRMVDSRFELQRSGRWRRAGMIEVR